MEEAENLLKKIGLTRYETRAYITLLKLGIATAEQISNVGNIPLPRVYDTLVELQKKGFVLISKGRPKKFRAASPKKALKSLIDIKKKDYDNKIKKMKGNVRNIVKILSKVPTIETIEKSKYDVWSTKRRKNVQKIFDEEEKLAKKEILMFSGDMSWLPERISNIRNSVKGGIKIRILMNKPYFSESVKKHIKKIKKMGVNLKTGYKGSLRGEIIDNKIALIAMKNPIKSKGDLKPEYELTIFNNPTMVNVFKENFEFLWNKLKS